MASDKVQSASIPTESRTRRCPSQTPQQNRRKKPCWPIWRVGKRQAAAQQVTTPLSECSNHGTVAVATHAETEDDQFYDCIDECAPDGPDDSTHDVAHDRPADSAHEEVPVAEAVPIEKDGGCGDVDTSLGGSIGTSAYQELWTRTKDGTFIPYVRASVDEALRQKVALQVNQMRKQFDDSVIPGLISLQGDIQDLAERAGAWRGVHI